MSKTILSLLDACFPNALGGAARVFYETQKELLRQGHTPVSITRLPDMTERSTVNIDGIKMYAYPDIPKNQISKILYYRKTIPELFKKALKETKPDAVILHSSSAAFGLLHELKKLSIPVIYYFHSPWSLEYLIQLPAPPSPLTSMLAQIRKKHENAYLENSDKIITLSGYMYNIMLHTHPELKKKQHIINPGAANFAIFHPVKNNQEKCELRKKLNLSENEFIIISSRRMVTRTGLDLLIKAFHKILKQIDKSRDVKLILTGNGPIAPELKQLAASHNILDHVLFPGYVLEETLAEYYRCSDLFVMPTRELEGFGLSTVEAMTSGIPVIGTNIGGTPEILTKISEDLIIPKPTSAAIALKMLEIINRSDINILAEKSFQCANKHFSWQLHIEKMLNFINS